MLRHCDLVSIQAAVLLGVGGSMLYMISFCELCVVVQCHQILLLLRK